MTLRMIFPGARLGHVRDDPHGDRAGDLPDFVFDRGGDLPGDVVAGRQSGFEGHVHLHRPAAELVHDGHGGGLGDLGHGQRGGFEFLGAQAVPGDVDDVVDPAEDAEVAVGGLDGAVAGEVGPVGARRVAAVLVVVDLHEPFGLAGLTRTALALRSVVPRPSRVHTPFVATGRCRRRTG
jgi:hypothetical protein